jgi:general secretion pathway protein G
MKPPLLRIDNAQAGVRWLLRTRLRMKKAFSLVELMIVVAVLGILAAIVVPQFREHSTLAKEAVAKDSLRVLRGAIELYTAQHGGIPPGYEDDDVATTPAREDFYNQLVRDGRYLLKIPINPFNNLDTIQIIGNSGTFPANADGGFGWVYQPATKTIRLDWSGADKDGVSYFDY